MKLGTRRFLKLYMAILTLAVLLLGGCDMVRKNNAIAYIDIAAVLSGSELIVHENAHIEAVVEALKKAQTEAEALYGKMEAAKADAARKADQQTMRQILIDARQAARMAVLKEIRTAADDVRKSEKFSMVLSSTQVLSAETSLNVTDNVIALVKSRKPEFGALPEITVAAQTENKKEMTH